MYIGQLAKLTGCTPKAIRLYESIGLMPAPDRQGKYRVYTQHHADVVHTIRVAQSAGFKLAELHGLIEEKLRTGHFPLEMALQAISVKRGQVEAHRRVRNPSHARADSADRRKPPLALARGAWGDSQVQWLIWPGCIPGARHGTA